MKESRRQSTARRIRSTKRSSASATASAGALTARASPTGSSTRPASGSSRSSTTRPRSYPTIAKIPYPRPGPRIPPFASGSSAPRAGQTTWGWGNPWRSAEYVSGRVWEWGLDSRHARHPQQLNRLQNQNDFLIADAGTGKVTRVFRDQSKAWVDVVEEVRSDPTRAGRFSVDQRARWLAARLPRAACRRGRNPHHTLRRRRHRGRRARRGERLAVFPRLARQSNQALLYE